MPRFTLNGFYEYFNEKLFDSCEMPESMDKDVFVDTLIAESGQLYPYYQTPYVFKHLIEVWFKRRYHNHEMMFKAILSEYNPIENYDRNEETIESPEITRTGRDTVSGTSDSSTINSVAGFNSTTTQVHDQQIGSANARNTSESTEKESGTRTTKSRVHGNIGVTTNQSMINAELELRKYDIYKEIAMEFEKDFLVQVY